MGLTRTVLTARATGAIGRPLVRLLLTRGQPGSGHDVARRARALVQTGAIPAAGVDHVVAQSIARAYEPAVRAAAEERPLDATKAPPAPVSPIKTLSYAIQAQSAPGWFELALIGVLLVWSLCGLTRGH